MAQKQITFNGTMIEKDCRDRPVLCMILNPNKHDVLNSINPVYRASSRPDNESTLNEFGERQ
jgi:hypothetical protein